jgi:hypothetical protein
MQLRRNNRSEAREQRGGSSDIERDSVPSESVRTDSSAELLWF